MNEPIKFREYEPKSRSKLKELGLRKSDFKKLIALNKREKRTILQINSDRVKATSFVGIISTGRNTIHILPKLSREENETQIIRNLLYMLSYTKRLQIKEADISRLCERKRYQLLEILIYLFSKNLFEVLKTHFFRDYRVRDDDLFYIKGRIAFGENIKRNYFRHDRIYCYYSEFTENVLMNQIFRYTVFLLSRLTSNKENGILLKQLTLILSEIELRHIIAEDFDKVKLNRLNRRFEPLLQLSRIFIVQSSIELFNDKLETFSFIFDMEELFEEFVAELIKKHRNQLIPKEASIRVQDTSKKLVDRPKSLFTLKPDILIKHDSNKIILDTKYKELDPTDTKEGVSQSDMYQMLAYAVKHGSQDCVLIYPTHLEFSPSTTTHIISYDEREIKVHIKTIPLDIDMMQEKERLIKSLAFITEIINS